MKESIRKILKENLEESYYDRDKLYSKAYIERVMAKAPRNLKKYFLNLEEFDCADKNGQAHKCVKIPEVLHTFIVGKY
jgi:hypothetical protein|tara:strand:+ start:2353 stop:2586 length:234 start_codon:yes stop_codon:yes gene_type:complete